MGTCCSSLAHKICRPRHLITLLAVSVCSILYLTRSLPRAASSINVELEKLISSSSTQPADPIQWGKSPNRLLVFGDSWSDDGHYPIDPPASDQTPVRDEARGRVWTEHLCAVVSCTHHDNFARSLPHSWNPGYGGAVVDNGIMNSTLTKAKTSNNTVFEAKENREPLADFKAQVQQWLGLEKQQFGTSRTETSERSGTVFAIWFSLWDLWYYSGVDLSDAQLAVTKTIDAFFEQLDLLAENWPFDLKVIVPYAIDMTFLPGWQMKRTGLSGPDVLAVNQRNAVTLVRQWNQALATRFSRWGKGEVYLYNTFDWLLDQVREQQLFSQQMADANGLGIMSPWTNVFSGCVADPNHKILTKGLAETVGQCSDPKTYLFWDDMHLGPEAMKMIGEDIAVDIGGHRGGTWFSRDADEHSGLLQPR